MIIIIMHHCDDVHAANDYYFDKNTVLIFRNCLEVFVAITFNVSYTAIFMCDRNILIPLVCLLATVLYFHMHTCMHE